MIHDTWLIYNTFVHSHPLDCLKPGGSLLTARPTVLLGVPHIWEKLTDAKKKSATTTGLKKHIATWATISMSCRVASCPVLSYHVMPRRD